MGSGVDIHWCLTTLPILKWLQIMFTVIVIVLIERSVYVWGGYAFIVVICAFTLAITILTLLLYFLKMHLRFKEVPWPTIEVGFNGVACLLFVISFGLGLYDCIKMFNTHVHWRGNHYNHHRGHIPLLLSYDEWRNRVAAATAFCGGNVVFYILAALYAKRGFI